jgi:hypothetical protein
MKLQSRCAAFKPVTSGEDAKQKDRPKAIPFALFQIEDPNSKRASMSSDSQRAVSWRPPDSSKTEGFETHCCNNHEVERGPEAEYRQENTHYTLPA